ncbi:helix-turn-helix domain-containing protein [Sphingomonas sp. AOB5]|uniref:helix-turn-helix domain-containing protein n=1 Tax=Sphingomonas sp. AOB5 TaxID=3034017 RepID=UPI003211D771
MTATRSHLDRTAYGKETADNPSDLHNLSSLAPITVRIPEATRMLGISRSRVYELITSGDIEVIKLGRSTLVPVAGLHALVQRLREEQLG